MGNLVTIFSNLTGTDLTSQEMTVPEVAAMIGDPAAAAADPERLFKYAKFGNTATAAGSLRHDGNVVSISGIEIDVDDARGLTFAEGCARLDATGIAYDGYRTKRSKPGAERFRFLLPTSRDLAPSERSPLVDRVNGVLGGIVARESWSLSQGYFISVNGKPPADIVFNDSEEFIDEAAELDSGALPYQPPPSSPGATGAGGKLDLTKLDDTALRELIETRASDFSSSSELCWHWARAGVREEDALANLEQIYDGITSRDQKWRKARISLPRWVARVYARAAAVAGGKKPKGSGRPLNFIKPDPWPDKVGDEIADEIAEIVRSYVVLSKAAKYATTLWVIHTYKFDAALVTPRLLLKSAEKRSGKTTLLSILEKLVAKPLFTANISPSALYRTVELAQPTLLVDEADSFISETPELRGILNAGYRRGGAVVRNVGEDHEPRLFSCHAPAAIATIKPLHDTIEDRSISIPMKRRRKDEHVTSLRLDRLTGLATVTSKIQRWANDNAEALETADPELPALLNDRAADCWRILVAIADRLGGEWPERARKAAVTLSFDNEDVETVGTQLLADLRTMFEQQAEKIEEDVTNGHPRIENELFSAEIVSVLSTLEGRPWPEYGERQQPITKNQLAKLLSHFGIRPGEIYRGTKGAPGYRHSRGYKRAAFDDAFERYLG